MSEGRASSGLAVDIVDAADPSRQEQLAHIDLASGETRSLVIFNWPVWSGSRNGFHLLLRQSRGGTTTLSIGPLFNPRRRIIPLGRGIEVEPGLNPQIVPARDVDVRYGKRSRRRNG